MDYEQMISRLELVAREAGEAIMRIHAAGVDAESKKDGSPVTEADRAAEAIILPALQQAAPDIQVISEENEASHRVAAPERFFLVDPLDGTKEFLKADGKGAFTVNIALIENGVPTLGIVYAPALDRMFSGASKSGARENNVSITVRSMPENGKRIAVASASHRDEATNQWLADNIIEDTVSIGSSLKFCLLAAGEADVYPRYGPTMEWDTAAGHAVLLAAGGGVTHPDNSPFTYGKPEYRNGPFIAWGKT